MDIDITEVPSMNPGTNWEMYWGNASDSTSSTSGSESELERYLLELPDQPSTTTTSHHTDIHRQPVFCTVDNLSKSIHYVNASLEAFGFESPVVFLSTNPTDVAKVVNTVYAMLCQRQKDIEFREETLTRQNRLQIDKDQLLVTQVKLQERLETAEKDVATRQAKERALLDNHQHQRERWDSERDELQKRLVMLQHKDTQYQHEIRKKEKLYDTLKEKMNHMLLEKNREVKNSSEILSALQKDKKGVWKNNKNDDMYRMVIDRYEDKLKSLTTENNDLRNSLKELQQELQDLLNTHNITRFSINNTDIEELHEAQFDLPFDMMRGSIDNLHEKMNLLRKRIATIGKADEESNSEALRNKIRECQKIIEEQDQLLQLSLSANRSPHVSFDDSRIETSKRSLEQERLLFEEQRTNFEQERRSITEATIKLTEDRLQLEKDKKEFNDQYAQWLTQTQNESFCKSCSSLTPGHKTVPASPSILKLFSSPGMSPISRRKNWVLPEDPNQFINELSFKNEIPDGKEDSDDTEM